MATNEANMSAENFIANQLQGMGVSSSAEIPAPPAQAKPAAEAAKPAAPAARTSQPAAPAAQPVTPAVPPGTMDAAALTGIANAALSAATGVVPAEVGDDVAETAAESQSQDEAIPAEAAATENSRNAWTKIKRENKELKTKLHEFEQKLKAGDPDQDAKLQQMAEQIAEYENKLGRLDLTQSKAFHDKYDAPINQLRARSVQVIAKVTDRTPEEAAKFFRDLEGSDMNTIRQALSDEPNAVQSAVVQNLIEIQEASAIRERAVADWKNTKSAVTVSKSKDEEAELLRQVVASTSDAVRVLSAKPEDGGEGSWIFQDQPENPLWQEQKSKIVSAARAALRDRKEVPKLVLEGVAAGVYRKLAEQLYRQVTELQNAVSSRDRIRPHVSGRVPERGAKPSFAPTADPQSFVEGLMNDK